MKSSILLSAAAALLLSGGVVLAHESGTPHAHGHINKRPHTHSGPVITKQVRVNCFRGPFKVTAWDHPEADFIEDLIGIGYDYTQAWAIGERVCKDSGGVGNASVLRDALLNAIAQNPPDH